MEVDSVALTIGLTIFNVIFSFYNTKKMIKHQRVEMYFSKVKQINEKISNMVYPLLIQNQPIERDGIEAIIGSFTKDSNIKKKHLHTYPSLIKDAIAKIVSSEVSLSDKKRADLINRLSIELIEVQKTGEVITPKIDKSDITPETKEEKRKIIIYVIIFALITIFISLISIIFFILPIGDYPASTGINLNFYLVLLIMVIFIVVSNLLIPLTLKFNMKKEEDNRKKENETH